MVPVSIAPWIDPTGGPLATAGPGGVFTLSAVNVPAAGAELRLATVPMQRMASGPLSPGEWTISGPSLEFVPPPNLPTGNYAVRLRATNIEADPSQWAVIP
jgi:hypothetical protein